MFKVMLVVGIVYNALKVAFIIPYRKFKAEGIIPVF